MKKQIIFTLLFLLFHFVNAQTTWQEVTDLTDFQNVTGTPGRMGDPRKLIFVKDQTRMRFYCYNHGGVIDNPKYRLDVSIR